ncbi:CocE/NonD family hydrolase C-terminal non-catalytic domain-containing protein [Pseudonocardia sp. ICBG162]|uniref:CocE/NonD family hydrolase C-terminal non-catalytic domain-containing protein n=1 Tax=Pseudonocardia sp. ICBG162 TaxID=2846761 RepID=UPI001CF6CB92|nr:CocE/NonD family hydrolase C-terminal non-catalytic domain-containing protein [Pseudonocardia sp. ICBG162]
MRAGDGPTLAVDAVPPGGLPAGFVADPDRPVRSRAPGAPVAPDPGPDPGPGSDTHRSDRVVAHTPPLPAGALAGPLVVTVTGDTDALDADWVVRVGLRGHDLVTAVHRHRGPASRQVVVTTPPVGAAVHEGDRLRVEIAGHHWPAHARNPHTGQDPAHATALRADHRTVHALRLDLPHVRPGRDEVAAAAIPEEVTL